MDGLPLKTREIAKQKFELLKRDPYHPSLHFKKVGNYWSARVNIGYRALAIEIITTPYPIEIGEGGAP